MRQGKGVLLKNADRIYNSYHRFSSNQIELREVLEKIWNNQDFLTQEDKKILTFLGKKSNNEKYIFLKP